MAASAEAAPHRLVLFFFSLFFCGKSILCDEECTPGIKSMGYTVPKGDITVRLGNPLDIHCVLNEEEARKRGPNPSQYLRFEVNSNELSREMVQVINSTTIKLHIENPVKANQENYMCVYKNGTDRISVCMNFVYVGVPPQKVSNFSCVSNNLDNVTCKWNAPDNCVTTTYNLSYSTPEKSVYNCPKIEEKDGSSEMSCTWSLHTDPIYRQSVAFYDFSMSMSNVFGSANMPHMKFNHFANVRPRAPENLKALGKTSNSILLSWTVPTTMQTFSPGLYHRILYQSVYGDKKWQSVTPFLKKEVNEVQFNLDNLEYAHTYYDIRVSLRSTAADPKDEYLWSDNATLTAITESKRPDDPPRTNIGSFEILAYGNNSDRNVRIYWSHIPEERRNGEEFDYVVGVEGEMHLNKTTKNAFMPIDGLSIHKSYIFYVWAKNEKGISAKKSVIRVPAHQDCPRGPSRLTKEELGGGRYRLTWQPPKLDDNQIIKNYTIFWCNDERELPPCSGKLDWLTVPGKLNTYNQTIPSNKTYQFAISANTERGSSGMVWTHCTDLYYKDSVGKINGFWRTHVDSHSTVVNWSFGCSDKSVTGFIVYYCSIRSPEQNRLCKGPRKNVTVSSDISSVEIHNLAPYTTYSMQVAAIINYTTFSQLSESLLLTTLEAAPSVPTDLAVVNKTNSTITITWKPPVITNGPLKYYKVYYNQEETSVDRDTFKVIEKLESFVEYNITVQACTVKCSNNSEILKVRTEIGHPGAIRRPLITQNATYTLIMWDTPDHPNGRNEYFELRIKEKRDYENVTKIFNATVREWGIQSCGRDNNSFFVSVRAVNVYKDKVYYGQWSDEVESYCRSPSNYIIYFLVPVSIVFLLGMTYLFKKIYGHFQEMRDVGVKLPQGLQGEVIETDINLSNWTQKSNNDDGDRHATEDERHLLMKKTEGSPNANGGDSSGCSSAHGSVVCSVDSTSNLSTSTSDSGTEQPRTPSAEDLTDLGLNSLRQRNIRPSATKPYVCLSADGTHPGPTKSSKTYCVLGVDSSVVAADAGSTFIPTLGFSEKTANVEPSNVSPPYVLTGELVKTSNPSYVPYKATDATAPNPPYVVAGSNLMSPDASDVDPKQYAPTKDGSTYKKLSDISLSNAPPTPITNSKTGYVSIGDVLPAQKKESKGYVPHRQFESKALKED